MFTTFVSVPIFLVIFVGRGCMAENEKALKCLLPVSEGGCAEQVLRWFFNKESGTCQTFVYSGCGGNANNFNSSMYCLHACNGTAANTHQYNIDKATSDIKKPAIDDPDRRRELSVIRALYDGQNAGHKSGSSLSSQAEIPTTKEPGLLQQHSPNPEADKPKQNQPGTPGSNRSKREAETGEMSGRELKEKKMKRRNDEKEIASLKRMILQLSKSVAKLEAGMESSKTKKSEKTVRKHAGKRRPSKLFGKKVRLENPKEIEDVATEPGQKGSEVRNEVKETRKELIEKKIDVDIEGDDELEIVSSRIQAIIRDPSYVFSCTNMSTEDRVALEEISSDIGYVDALSMQAITAEDAVEEKMTIKEESKTEVKEESKMAVKEESKMAVKEETKMAVKEEQQQTFDRREQNTHEKDIKGRFQQQQPDQQQLLGHKQGHQHQPGQPQKEGQQQGQQQGLQQPLQQQQPNHHLKDTNKVKTV